MDDFRGFEQWCGATFPGLAPDERSGPTFAQDLLRFELGAPYKRAADRVAQATRRAAAIFQAVFENEDQIELLVFDFGGQMMGGVEPQRRRGEGEEPGASEARYLALNTVLPTDGPVLVRTLGPSAYRTGSVQQRLLRVERASVDHAAIFRAIAGCELGVGLRLAETVHFYSRAQGLCFYMYDDRGCVVVGAGVAQQALAARFSAWVIAHRRGGVEQPIPPRCLPSEEFKELLRSSDGPAGVDRLGLYIRADLLSESQLESVASIVASMDEKTVRLFARHRLIRGLRARGIESCFDSVKASTDAAVHRVVLDLPGLQRHHVAWLAESGGNRKMRKMASQKLKRRSWGKERR